MDVPFASDAVSPQTPLVEEACAWLRARLDGLEGADAGDVREALAACALAMADAQPAMAALLSLGTRVLAVADKAAGEQVDGTEALARAQAALHAWRADFRVAGDAVARQAQAVLPASGWVATTTRSSLVERALLLAKDEGRAVRALVGESRPMYEGRGLAASLSSHGIPTWLAADGALPLLLPQAGAFLVGADAVRETTFVTKAGTYALLLVARELNLPAFVLAQRAKFVSDRCTRLTLPRLDPAAVWPEAPAGVAVVNAPFEEAPLALVRGVVTESGFLGAREAKEAAAAAPIAERLARGPGPSQG